MDVDAAAAMARALPGVTEGDHHGRPAFRVGGTKIIATVWSAGQLNVMVGEELAHASAGRPGVELLLWGERLSGVRVELAVVEPDLLDELLEDAWTRRAPASLRRPPGDGT